MKPEAWTAGSVRRGELQMIERRVSCDQCGSVILEHGSVMGAKACAAVPTYPEPLDLCADCLERFGDFMNGGWQAATAPEPSMKVVTR